MEQRQPIHLTDILFLLAKADLTGRCFSASPGKKKSLVDRYGQMTYIFSVCAISDQQFTFFHMLDWIRFS